jgi:hypothetical protein
MLKSSSLCMIYVSNYVIEHYFEFKIVAILTRLKYVAFDP